MGIFVLWKTTTERVFSQNFCQEHSHPDPSPRTVLKIDRDIDQDDTSSSHTRAPICIRVTTHIFHIASCKWDYYRVYMGSSIRGQNIHNINNICIAIFCRVFHLCDALLEKLTTKFRFFTAASSFRFSLVWKCVYSRFTLFTCRLKREWFVVV